MNHTSRNEGMDLMAANEQTHDKYESFEDFWSDFTDSRVVPTVDILGVDVPVPHDVSLGLQQRVFASGGNDYEGMAELMEQMFGEEILEALMEQNVTGDQMTIILAWGVMNGSGNKVSFREAAETFYSNTEGAEDADPPALAKAKASKAKATSSTGRKKSTRSSSTGSSSSRTSAGTTASARKTSRK